MTDQQQKPERQPRRPLSELAGLWLLYYDGAVRADQIVLLQVGEVQDRPGEAQLWAVLASGGKLKLNFTPEPWNVCYAVGRGITGWLCGITESHRAITVLDLQDSTNWATLVADQLK